VCAAALLAAPPAVAAGSLFAQHIVRLAASALAYALAYSVLAPLFGCFSEGDLEALRSSLSRTPIAPLAVAALEYEEAVLKLVKLAAVRLGRRASSQP